jgi:crotonobetainyl-CoA:carnitine CoA-transferase CaiB-like acyl-CoA transferase
MRCSRTPAIAGWAAPEIGQHNDYVLRELLGLTDQEIIELVTDEALQ